MLPTIPAFGETNFTDLQSTASTRIINICEAEKKNFSDYCKLFAEKGKQMQLREREAYTYAAYACGNYGVFLNYYPNLQELNVVIEENCRYFSFEDKAGENKVAPQITQIALEDYGMSYAVRLSDGRFVMVDGGTNFEPDVKNLYQFLQENCPLEKPVIAAWFFTHPDCDHFFLFNDFMDSFGDNVVVEKILMNFPDVDDTEQYSQLMSVIHSGNNGNGATHNEHYHRLLKHMENRNILLYVPRCGQIYQIGDATFEIFSCQDNISKKLRKFNPISLIFRMELAGQSVLFTGDAHMDDSRMTPRYGKDMKSDFMQIPHHGFTAGDSELAIEAYEIIKPSVCFLPGSTQESFCDFSTHVPQVEYIFTKLGVDEVISGTPQRTLTLPYTPSSGAKDTLRNMFLKGRECCGANMWAFADLDTGRKEDFEFSILNTTYMPAKVSVELYFADRKDVVHDIRFTAQPLSFRKVCIVDKNDVNINPRVLDRDTLEKKGYPKDVPFAVRFMCDVPLVISHKDHTPVYHTTNA